MHECSHKRSTTANQTTLSIMIIGAFLTVYGIIAYADQLREGWGRYFAPPETGTTREYTEERRNGVVYIRINDEVTVPADSVLVQTGWPGERIVIKGAPRDRTEVELAVPRKR